MPLPGCISAAHDLRADADRSPLKRPKQEVIGFRAETVDR